MREAEILPVRSWVALCRNLSSLELSLFPFSLCVVYFSDKIQK